MNNKKNYKPTTMRYKLINLMHITGVLTPRSYQLFDAPIITVKKTIERMKKEGIIEKVRNGEVFNAVSTINYPSNLKNYFSENIPEANRKYYNQYSSSDIRLAKYRKDKLFYQSTRVIRSAEVTTIMYAAGVPTLPSDKPNLYTSESIESSAYYQSREIKAQTTESDKEVNVEGGIANHATRINGALISKGGNYCVYNFGHNKQAWYASGEYRFREFISTTIFKYQPQLDCRVNSAIVYVHTLDIFYKIINQKKPNRYGVIIDVYDKLYVLPYDAHGRDMTKIMQIPNWDNLLMAYLLETPLKDTSKESVVCDYVEDSTYILIFCIPDIEKLIAFRKAAIEYNDKSKFSIYCFDYQKEFVEKCIGSYAEILTTAFDDTYNDFYNKYQR